MSTPKFEFEYPDEAGYPDGTGFLSQDQIVLIGEVADDPFALADDFFIAHHPERFSYDAIVGDTQVGTLEYSQKGQVISLLTTKVWPEYRGQGIATELIRRVLDDINARGLTITILCPIIRTFVDYNPSYERLINASAPGVIRVR